MSAPGRPKRELLPLGGKALSAKGSQCEAGELDVFACSLDGIDLIEASAGTGKTWNICGLYLRLLLERKLDVQRILVVTFTNAATAELRERIRARIVETLAWLNSGHGDAHGDDPAAAAESAGDPFVPALVRAVVARTGLSPAQLALTLDTALQYFDEAAIYTIHGFCKRALADASFSAGLPFALDLVTDDREMALEAVHDFWRRRVADPGFPPELAAHLLHRRDTPEKFAKLLTRRLAKPLARYLWPAGLDADAPIDTSALAAAFATASGLWDSRRDEIVARVEASLDALRKNSYTTETVARAAHAWDDWFRDAMPLAPFARNAKPELLSAATLADRTKTRCVTPAHPFFDAADVLLAAKVAVDGALERARLRLIRALIEDVGPELRERKRERRVIAFDDMLYNLHAALEGGTQPQLVASLREKFPVALIDEFQDTDPLQYAIFERIYAQGGLPAFLVGDPKQAIYSFRHADLNAYLRARRDATALHTLAANQRSTRGLIESLNALFSTNPGAFMLPGLDYHPVTMGDKRRKPFVDASLPRADLVVWTLPQAPEGGLATKLACRDHAAQASAAEIARLLTEAQEGRIAIDGRALRAGDIAVLVRTNAQGSDMKRALSALNVGSVELSQASVFQSADAEELERVLIAINEPSRDALLRGALATEMMGCDAARVAEIAADESALLGYLERFAAYRDLWQRQGVGIMYRRFLHEEQVNARMLRRNDGERRLTNLLHLGEQIHQAAALHDSPDALLRWLAAQRREDALDEVAQLRLESDRNLVQIITIHKAKGLEFPVVFCPFLWDGLMRYAGPKPEGREYHAADGQAVVDFRLADEIGPADAAIKAQTKREDAAESLRLVYVALTRAVYRCYVVAGTYASGRGGSHKDSTGSLLNWLVAGGAETPEGWFEGTRTADEIAAAWHALAQRVGAHLGLGPLPLAPGVPVASTGPPAASLAALAPPRSIAPAWRISSFSGVILGAKDEAAASDHDARVAEGAARAVAMAPGIAPDDILRFPRGPSAGECLHAIFERIDFTVPATWSNAIARGLHEHPQALAGARAAEQGPLLTSMAARMLADVMATRLPDGIVLGALPSDRRLVELEFNLPAPRLAATALNAALRTQGYDVPRLAFRDLEGYLKGYIDLVFEHAGRWYVLDWKSNHLGNTPADYGPAALRAAMAGHGYHLQYLLYAVAVGRYLRHRVPGYRHDAHFGGVLYLFVRGVRPGWINADGTPAGVFHHRPSAATLARLDALLGAVPAKVSR